MSNSFKWDFSGLDKGLEKLALVEPLLHMYCETKALQFESYAKENRPWTDRTNMARQTLKGEVEKKSFGFRITLSYGVDYGLWLELANEKKYAIVEPTIRLKSPEVIKGMESLLKAIK